MNAASWKRAWIIQASSSLEKRWEECEKQYEATRFVMKPFSLDEMAALG
jgi:hypothetical protein